MNNNASKVSQRSHRVVMIMQLGLGAVGGVTIFAVVSFVSLWATFNYMNVALAAACLIVGAVVVGAMMRVHISSLLTATATLIVTLIVAVAVSLNTSPVVSGLSPYPFTLLRHGGQDSTVLIVTGAIIATALVRLFSGPHRSARRP